MDDGTAVLNHLPRAGGLISEETAMYLVLGLQQPWALR